MVGNIERREFIRSSVLVAGAAVAAAVTDMRALAQATTEIGHKPMAYDIKPSPSIRRIPKVFQRSC